MDEPGSGTSAETAEQPRLTIDPAEASTARAVRAFVPRLAVWVALLTFIGVADPDPALSLMLVALAGIVTIISDDRFAFERHLEEAGVPSREAWVPLAMLVVLNAFDLVDPSHVGDVLRDDGPVIAFILAFALVAEGLRRSGFIHFLAYRLTDRGGSNTTRLMLYLFLLSSLLAYFTSNDIVILTMTPIVVSVAYQARVANAKLLLLSQFIAANTVSMGLLIGSPSNLIVGRAIGLGFFEYMFLMAVPALMALMGTFVLVTAINRFVQRRADSGNRVVRSLIGTWAFSPGYRPPRFSEFRSFTRDMRRWVAVFGLSVGLLAIGTSTGSSGPALLVVSLTIATLGVVSLYRGSREHDEPNGRTFAGKTFRCLPLGIVFFGLTYFVIADGVADTPFVRGDVDEFVSEQASHHTPLVSWGSTLTAGALVNTMNDLPAGALSGKVLERAEFTTPFDRSLVTQSTLVGLNIATYVTPVGALAGIIWFDILRKERRRRYRAALAAGEPAPFDVVMPQRRDLIIYGATTFLAMTAILGATNFGFVALADMLLGPPRGGSVFGSGPDHIAWSVGCLAVAVAVVIGFRRVLSRAGVALAHLSDLLVVLTSVRLWASRHRVAAGAAIAGLLFVGTGALLYWAESFHTRLYDRPVQFDDPGQFITWLTVFVSSGFENNDFPYSVLGNILAAVLALGSIAALVVLIRLSTGSNDLNLRRKLGQGEIPTDRLVIVNCAVEHRGLVRTLIAESSRFVTIATRDPLLEGRLGLRGRDRVAVIPVEEGSADLVAQLRLEEASELVLLSRSVTDDFDNLALLSALDATAGDRASEADAFATTGRARLAAARWRLTGRRGAGRAAAAAPELSDVAESSDPSDRSGEGSGSGLAMGLPVEATDDDFPGTTLVSPGSDEAPPAEVATPAAGSAGQEPSTTRDVATSSAGSSGSAAPSSGTGPAGQDSAKAPGSDDADRARRLPAVVLQLHERGLPALVDHRLGPELLESLARPPFEAVARAFVVADATGRLDDLRRLYAQPVVPGAESSAIDRRIRFRGLEVRLEVEPTAPTDPDEPIDVAAAMRAAGGTGGDGGAAPELAVGLQVEMAGWPVWRRFSSWRADEVPRPVTGVVRRLLEAAAPLPGSESASESGSARGGSGTATGGTGSDPAPAGGTAGGPPPAGGSGRDAAGLVPGEGRRDVVHVVGGDGFAQRCALDLVASGVPDVRLLAGPGEALLPGIARTEGLTVVACEDELRAADVLAQRDPAGAGTEPPSRNEAIVVVEGPGRRGLDCEKLLERLSIARLHEAEAKRQVPPLLVCCRGPERAQRLRNFVVDKVIDATWIESSYFAAFAAVYFDLVLEDETLANWPASRQLAVANRVASRLCHLDIGRPGDPRLAEVAAAPGAAARTAATAATSGTGVGDAVVGIIQLSVEPAERAAGAGARRSETTAGGPGGPGGSGSGRPGSGGSDQPGAGLTAGLTGDLDDGDGDIDDLDDGDDDGDIGGLPGDTADTADIADTGDDEPVVVVDIVPPDPDRPPGRRDLVAAVRYL